MDRPLSTAEVTRLLGLDERRLREWARSGLCRPARQGRRYAFSFQDLVVLRAAKGLLDAHVPAARIRRAIAALARELPEGSSLSGLRIFADGRDVAVRTAGSRWQPATGQTLFEFEVDGLAELVERNLGGAEHPAAEGPGARARRAFEEGLGLEDRDAVASANAYRRALELDPTLTDAYVNLGRLRHESGDAGEAARLYHLALEQSPDDPVLHFNLALALEDTRGAEAAISHYERALALDPDFADAHYNVAGLYEQRGRGADALRHYGAYKRLAEST
jgi:tetratricopeptide (TPR) repeat protein